jgi:hypothetical protein
MTDIFDNKILCKLCDKEMMKFGVIKDGFKLRALRCEKCEEIIIHPEDKIEYQNFKNLKRKNYNVKLRIVGNSYAVSIPKEIVNFINDHEKKMDEMVKLCFEDFNKISLNFN